MKLFDCETKDSMNKRQLREFLRSNLTKDSLEYFGMSDDKYLDHVTEAWLNDKNNSRSRYKDIEWYFEGELPKKCRILDMACGCGTFIFYGLLNGFDVYGIDPENWKHEFNKFKCDVYDYPSSWKDRSIKAVGESLPFPDNYFDFVSSYQTLEHVCDVEKCLSEMIRVLKGGGAMFLKIPDYRSMYEPHYRVPWLPLFPRPLAKLYLKILGRPEKGLATINYVTKRTIENILRGNIYVENIIDQKKNSILPKNRKTVLHQFNFFTESSIYDL